LQRKFLPLLLLLTISATISGNIRYASAQHETITFTIDPCTLCKIKISNGTGPGTITQTYNNTNSSTFWHGPYNITAIQATGYFFKNWNFTGDITAQSNITNPTNITYTGTFPSQIIARFTASTPTLQPDPILFLALLTTALPVLLRRVRKPTIRA
jgi:hypothetical protein